MATPGQVGFFDAARISGIMQGVTDPRLFPIELRWNNRVPDVPGTDEEITARFVGTIQIADLIMDDAKAVTYNQGRFQFQTTQVPNIKIGIAMNQALLNALERISTTGGIQNDDVGYFTNRYQKNVTDVKFGVELRKEVFKLAMLLDSNTYDRLGVKLTGVTFGMYSDLKVTPNTAWSNTSSTPLTDINNLRSIALQRYNIDLNRVTLATPALRAMVATTEYQSQVKNVQFAYLLGGPGPAAPLQGDQFLRRQAEMILGGTGTPVAIEIDDRRFWFTDNAGALTSNRIHPLNKVLLTSAANDGNGNAYDFVNCVITEGIVSRMVPGAAANVPSGRGPIGYATPADANLNPPGVVVWGVARGAPRKHMNQASAVLTIGTLTEAYDPTLPAILLFIPPTTQTETVMYDENDRLTRAGAEQVIREGGTVHLTRRTLNPDGTFKTTTREYKTVEQLPSEVEFAVDDPSAHQKALEGLKAQREQLDAQERKILEGAKAQDQARKAAEAAQRAREKAQGDAPPVTLHQQLGGRQLSGAENELAANEANANARIAQQRQRQGAGAAATDEGEEEHFAGKPLSAYDGVPDDQLEQQDGVGAATADKIAKARRARDRKAGK